MRRQSSRREDTHKDQNSRDAGVKGEYVMVYVILMVSTFSARQTQRAQQLGSETENNIQISLPI